MKVIPVTCAIIEQNGKILCAQRSEKMKHPLKWEFPGGKIEEAESPESCLHREIKEELGVEIEILKQLPASNHTYPNDIAIKLFPFRCKIISGKIILAEHKQIKWLSLDKLKVVDWVEADVAVVNYYTKNII